MCLATVICWTPRRPVSRCSYDRSMSEADTTEIARRGWGTYERDVKPRVEPQHAGRFVVVDVDTGGYALADDELDAFQRARQQMPEGTFYLVRVGQRAAHGMGRQHLR